MSRGNCIVFSLRQMAHAALAMIGIVPWLVAYLSMLLVVGIAVLGHLVHPTASRGNCWAYVLPRWAKRGGYIMVRMIDRPRIFGRRFIPHAIWVRKHHAESVIEQTQPINRAVRLHAVWRTFYFRYRVVESEHGHDARD